MRRAVIVVVVLIVLAVVADFGTAAAAEYQVSQQMRQRLQLSDDPDVRVTGFPFLTQAFAGDFQNVEVSADRISVGPLREVGVRAELHHVRVSLSDLLSSADRSVRVDDAVGTVRINANDLGRVLPGVTGLRIEAVDPATQLTPAAGGGTTGQNAGIDKSAVRLVGTVALLGNRTEVSVVASLQLAGKQIQITPQDIRVGNDPLPRVAQSAMSALFTLRLDPGSLPFAITPTSVTAADGALQVSGTAKGIVINGPVDSTAAK